MESTQPEKWDRARIAKRAREYAQSAELWREIASMCGHAESYTAIERDALAKLAWMHANKMLLAEIQRAMRVI